MRIKRTSKLLLSFSLLLFLSTSCFSQDQLILSNGKTMKGSTININKAKVQFEDARTGKRKWYKEKEIKKLVDKQNDDTVIEYEMRAIKGIDSYLSGALITGKANLFIIHKVTPGYQGISSYIHLYRQGEKQTTLIQPNSATSPFYKRMSKYFSDCSEVTSKLRTKEYKTNDIALIVQDYNATCSEG